MTIPVNYKGSADNEVLSDLRDMFQLVELEALGFPTQYVPPGKRHDEERQAQEERLNTFKANLYRKWLKEKAKAYQEQHPFLHFQLARICGLKNDTVLVNAMTNIRRSMEQVSVAKRAEYTADAHREMQVNAVLRMTKLPNFLHPGMTSHIEH